MLSDYPTTVFNLANASQLVPVRPTNPALPGVPDFAAAMLDDFPDLGGFEVYVQSRTSADTKRLAEVMAASSGADDPFWTEFSEELPGFLPAMLRLSPDIFAGFFAYCAIPWRSGTVRAKVKELAALACDAAPSHCFRPGFRVHLKNAIKLGVGRGAIFQTLDIAAAAPAHSGTQ